MEDLVSLNSITTEIALSLGRELDEPFKRVLAAKVDAWRSRLIRNSLQTKPQESKFFRQTIYVPMTPGSVFADCTDLELCNTAISIKTVPVPLRFGVSLFDYVGSVDGNNAFYEAGAGTSEFLSAGKYSRKTIMYSYIRGKIVIPKHMNLPAIRLDGVFDMPSQAMEFNCKESAHDCDYWNMQYPVTGDVKQMIVQGILQTDYAQPQLLSEDSQVNVNKP